MKKFAFYMLSVRPIVNLTNYSTWAGDTTLSSRERRSQVDEDEEGVEESKTMAHGASAERRDADARSASSAFRQFPELSGLMWRASETHSIPHYYTLFSLSLQWGKPCMKSAKKINICVSSNLSCEVEH